jgi:hypothetical protein
MKKNILFLLFLMGYLYGDKNHNSLINEGVFFEMYDEFISSIKEEDIFSNKLKFDFDSLVRIPINIEKDIFSDYKELIGDIDGVYLLSRESIDPLILRKLVNDSMATLNRFRVPDLIKQCRILVVSVPEKSSFGVMLIPPIERIGGGAIFKYDEGFKEIKEVIIHR